MVYMFKLISKQNLVWLGSLKNAVFFSFLFIIFFYLIFKTRLGLLRIQKLKRWRKIIDFSIFTFYLV